MEGCDGNCGTYFCAPTRPSFCLSPCTNAGIALRAEELRAEVALIVVWHVMSYSAHWR